MTNERIWIYTLSQQLTKEQLNNFEQQCSKFVNSWTAHDVKLSATFELYKNRLLIVKVNEESYNASGCSIDKLTRFVKELEATFSIELLNRLLVAYENENEIQIVNQSKIKELLSSNQINKNTLIYNNTITSSIELENNWQQALKDTWLTKYLV